MSRWKRAYFGPVLLIVLSTAAREARGDNGSVALARPVSRITIDGDLSDWPKSLPWYPVELPVSGERPRDAADFSAAFQLGYDKEALYVAIRVRDESIVVTGDGWWRSQDGCALYLDLKHTGKETTPHVYNIFGKGLPRAASGLAVKWSHQHGPDERRYEWRFDLRRLDPETKLQPGLVLGLGMIVHERDPDDQRSYGSRFAWGRGFQKQKSSAHLGDVLLVASETKVGAAHGRFVREIGQPMEYGAGKLQHRSLTVPLTVVGNAKGEFKVTLPVGDYRVVATSGDVAGRIMVKPGTTTPRLDFPMEPDVSDLVVVARKSLVNAGRGNRTGRIQRFGTVDGLPGGEFREVVQTNDGAIWIASGRGGLLRFDGRTITAFDAPKEFPSISCKSVSVDRHGTIWLTADQGDNIGRLFRFDGESFTRVLQDGGPNRLVDEISHAIDAGWVRDRFRVYRHRGSVFETIYQKNTGHTLLAMAIESDSCVWVGTSHGLVQLTANDGAGSKGNWRDTRFDTCDGLPDGGNLPVRALLVDSAGQLWMGTDRGLCQYDGRSFKSWTEEIGEVRVDALAETKDGTIWIGTKPGLIEFRDGEFTRIAGTRHVHSLFVDREHNIWIAGRGLQRYERQLLPPQYRSEMEVADTGKLLLTRSGELWAGTSGGLVRCADGVTTWYSNEDIAGTTVMSLFEDSRGGVWIGTERGITHFDGSRFAPITGRIGAPSVNAIAEDGLGRIWLGMRDGVTIHDPSQGREDAPQDGADDANSQLAGPVTHLSVMDGLQSNQVNALLADSDGSVWLGTRLGISRWRDDDLERFESPQGVVCFLQDPSNQLWAGGDGLHRFDGTRWLPITDVGKARVTGLSYDASGRIWMATNLGLKVYDGFAVQTLSAVDGVLDSCTDVLWNQQQDIVIVAGDTLTAYAPQSAAPPITITHLATDKREDSTSAIRFSSAQPSLQVSFHGVSYRTRPDAMRYRYRLRGFDENWKLTGNNQVSYGRLPPGEYTFEVAAIDRDLNYSVQPATAQIIVDQAYGQLALWSSLIGALVAVAMLSVVVVRRNLGIRRLNRELEQRVKDRSADVEREMAEKTVLNARLVQTQKLDAVGTLASGVAHDINNSLSAITGFAELAESSQSNSGEYISHILTAAKQAAGTTRSLLTFSRQASEERVPRDLVETVKRTANFLRKMMPASIELATVLPEVEAIWCAIDDLQIQQVLVNVTVNARDALPDGGKVSICVEQQSNGDQFARLLVTDNGVGMATDVCERVFDPFFTTKSRGQGTGLGMSVVHGILTDHDGTIEIDSTPGQGTTVVISIPCCQPATSPDLPADPVVDGQGATVLVVEDNSEVRHMLRAHLESVGFRTCAAEDGFEALRILDEGDAVIRLAILDVDLPGKDGLTFQREINSLYPDVPTIMMSGLASVDPARFGTPFLRKPFSRQELLATISTTLRDTAAPQTRGVLIVDDDEAARRSTQLVLSAKGFEVFAASDAKDAVAQLQTNLERIGSVLLDWHLPNTDPLLTFEQLRRVSESVPVLVVSGDLSLDAQELQAEGFYHLLRKPCSADELVKTLSAAHRDDA